MINVLYSTSVSDWQAMAFQGTPSCQAKFSPFVSRVQLGMRAWACRPGRTQCDTTKIGIWRFFETNQAWFDDLQRLIRPHSLQRSDGSLRCCWVWAKLNLHTFPSMSIMTRMDTTRRESQRASKMRRIPFCYVSSEHCVVFWQIHDDSDPGVHHVLVIRWAGRTE